MNTIPAQLIEQLDSSDIAERERAARAIRAMNSDIIPPLADLMTHGTKRQQVEAARIIATLDGPRATKALANALNSPNVLVGHAAADRLKADGAGYVAHLLAQMPNTHPTVQVLLPDIIELYGTPEHLPALAAHLQSTEFPALQRELIDAMDALGAGSDYQPLIASYASSPDRHVQKSVAYALFNIKQRESDDA